MTGGTGQVGRALQQLTWPADVTLHVPGRDELDLSDAASVERVVSEGAYGAVISSGAYTAVDRAENDVRTAWAVNALAPAALAAASGRTGLPIIHLSTDYVFDGSQAGFYQEADPVNPINVYGASKEGGEQAVRSANTRHVILRTSWVNGPDGRNFVKTMIEHGKARPEVRVVADQLGCPTFSTDVAEAVRSVLMRMVNDAAAPTGTFHFVNAGEASWAEFAQAIFAESARRGGPSTHVRAITTAEYPTPARRPSNSRLGTEAIKTAYGIRARPWQEALADTLDALLSGNP